MTTFFLIIIIIVLIVQLNNKSKDGVNNNLYQRGYQDGWDALKSHVSVLLGKDKINKKDLQDIVAKGPMNGAAPVAHAAQRVARPPVDEKARALRNTNIVLYLASFLFVAAGAAFIAAAVDDTVKLLGVWLLVAAFYGSGLYIHSNMERLKPAAVAFAGTGMALLPFAGVALHRFGGVTAEFAWLVTSFIGLVAYFWVAIRLNSIVVSYLTMAFVFSLVSSGVAVASLPIVWGFTSFIVVALIASLISLAKPMWMPSVFRQPVEQTGQIMTPAALVSSLFVNDQLSTLGYEMIFSVATAHYFVVWLQTRQSLYENITRIVAHLAALIFAWDISGGDSTIFGFWFLAFATGQLAVSLFRRRQGFRLWLWSAMTLQFFANIYWGEAENPSVLVSLSLALLGVSSLAVAYLLRSVTLAIPVLAVSVILPLVTMRGAIEPHLEWGWVANWYLVSAVAALYGYMQWASRHSHVAKMYVAAGFAMYMVMAVILATLLGSGSATMLLAVGTVLLFVASYVLSVPEIVFAGAITGSVAAMRFWDFMKWDQDWLSVGPSIIICALLVGISWVMLSMDDERRRRFALYSAWFIGGFGVLSGYFAYNNDNLALAAAGLLVAVAISIVLEGRRSGRQMMVETGVYVATLGLQRMVGIWNPELNSVFYAHWWAAAIASMAIIRSSYVPRLMVAMGFITAVTGVYALGNGDSYSLLFLAEHVALVLLGVYLSKNWAIWWGIIASSFAVLYFLRDIAFAAFGFLGLLLIGFVIWRLIQQDNKKS